MLVSLVWVLARGLSCFTGDFMMLISVTALAGVGQDKVETGFQAVAWHFYLAVANESPSSR